MGCAMADKTNLITSGGVVTHMGTNQELAIDSDTLLQMVNEARKECGEKPIRNNDFIARIKNELEGEDYEIFVVQHLNNTTSGKAVMRVSQAIRVVARSKVVLRSLT
ncbi:TPA: hypothetical protein H2X16_002547 [Salmonella enterica]|nr:hypothetical protein [Salmonella enterica]EDQ9665864.1 hypothetical protein [Salmonella enterica subsp. enterica serovar Bredeney]EDV4563440.1 hypothetical protein [Salmonella enterica subsp. enterica]HAK8134639.1 hypothetical protein [Salmonella enterica]HAK8272935.1 hypothetical protein [Salmonella enterica]